MNVNFVTNSISTYVYCLSVRYVIFLLYLLSTMPAVAAPLSKQDVQTIISAQNQAIESKVIETVDRRLAMINSQFAKESKAHREYLQSLDDRFYERISFWLPTAISFITIIFLTFTWWLGKSKSEALQDAVNEISRKSDLEIDKAIQSANIRAEEKLAQFNLEEFVSKHINCRLSEAKALKNPNERADLERLTQELKNLKKTVQDMENRLNQRWSNKAFQNKLRELLDLSQK